MSYMMAKCPIRLIFAPSKKCKRLFKVMGNVREKVETATWMTETNDEMTM